MEATSPSAAGSCPRTEVAVDAFAALVVVPAATTATSVRGPVISVFDVPFVPDVQFA
ncbi:hypothetical protein ACIPY2_05650 [Paenarthrobacter sp. NPDC089675]|uniref:hypothetical protein n=1 Tax=Paenarthrobacter sp. NPDC089675 TaxID=3364376 RepID=UPI0038209529